MIRETTRKLNTFRITLVQYCEMILHVAGMKLQTKLALFPVTAAIVAFKEIFQIALADWFLWVLLFALISVDTFLAVMIAIFRRKFDWKRLAGYFKRVFILVGMSITMSLFAAAYDGRDFSATTVAFFRDFVSIGLNIYMLGRIAVKSGGEGRLFWRYLSDAIEKSPFKNGNGNGNENGK